MKTLIVFLILIATISTVTGQEQYFEDPIPFDLSKKKSSSVSFADIDMDGDIDIIVANGRHWPDQNEAFINSGSGVFNTHFSLSDVKSTSYAAGIGDFNADGFPDIAVGNDKEPNTLLMNDGSGKFIKKGGFGADDSNT